MKKIVIILALTVFTSVFTINAFSAPNIPFYDFDTRKVHIPVLNLGGIPTFAGIELYLRDDGLLEFSAYREYDEATDAVEPEGIVVEIPKSFDIIPGHGFGICEEDEVYTTKGSGNLIIITGMNFDSNNCEDGLHTDDPDGMMTFKLTPANLPEPMIGTKGSHYFVRDDKIVYADILYILLPKK
jgi:hypothetical protein